MGYLCVSRLHNLYHRAGQATLWKVTYNSVRVVKPLQFTTNKPNMVKACPLSYRTSCVQAGFSSASCSSSSLSSLTIPSSILSSLSLWPSRYLGLGAALVVNSPPGRAWPSPNRVSFASLSIAFARQEAKVSRDLCTSAWTWTEDVFSTGEKKGRYWIICQVYYTRLPYRILMDSVICFVAWWPQTHFLSAQWVRSERVPL